MMLDDGDTFETEGHKFKVKFHHDDHHGHPWDEEDGHGPVSDWVQRSKRPGERVLVSGSHGRYRFYDFQGAVKQAKAEGWGAEPYGGTKGQRAARAADADYNRLRRYCTDQWSYVGIEVQLLDDEEDPIDGYKQSLWGIESDCYEYHKEVATELASELLLSVGAEIAMADA